MVLAALVLAPAAAAAPRGFHVNGVRCAVGLQVSGLLCASPAVKRFQYDGRGIARLHPRFGAVVYVSGSDLLLAIDRAGKRALPTTRIWRAAGYACARLGGGVACARGGHGFFLSTETFRRF